MTREVIERYNSMVKLFEVVDKRPKAYCIEVKEGNLSIYLEDIKSSNNLIDNTEPKYRPFKSKEECWQEMQKHQPFGWIKKNGNYVNIMQVSEESSYDVGLKNLTFVDGTPFGIKEE